MLLLFRNYSCGVIGANISIYLPNINQLLCHRQALHYEYLGGMKEQKIKTSSEGSVPRKEGSLRPISLCCHLLGFLLSILLLSFIFEVKTFLHNPQMKRWDLNQRRARWWGWA